MALSIPQDNHGSEGVFKLKKLVNDLEDSFRVSNAVDNNLLLKCVLLEAENDNLRRIASDKSVKLQRESLSYPLQLYCIKNFLKVKKFIIQRFRSA